MQYPITASVIFVQLHEDSDVTAHVRYEAGRDGGTTVKADYKLGTLPDAVDLQMWMQMAAASVCDAL